MNRAEIIKAAENMDWVQVVLSGGPPCFHIQEDGHFCGRAKRWIGHNDSHKFVPIDELLHSLIALVPGEGIVVVPEEPTEAQWNGLARAIMMWLDMNTRKTPRSLLDHLNRSGQTVPKWLLDEPEMEHLDHSMSKGTRCVIIYKAMLKAAKEEK